MTELWTCSVCGGQNSVERDECLGCGTQREENDEILIDESETRSDLLQKLREEAKSLQKWDYVTLVFKVERDGVLGSTFPGQWMHEVVNPEASVELLDELEVMGQLGWELVSVIPNSRPSLTREAGETTEWLFFFKRAVEA